jgi:hypothetical protein
MLPTMYLIYTFYRTFVMPGAKVDRVDAQPG